MTETSVRVADLFARPISLIDPDPDNPRDLTSEMARADIEEIALSMLAEGFFSDRALTVRARPGGRWMVTDGHKRFAAVHRAIELGADLRLIPCKSEDRGTNEQDRAYLRLRAPSREFTPLEAAVDIKRLLAWGHKPADIAKRLGRNLDWLHRCLELAAAPTAIHEAVKTREIAPTEARRVAREVEPLIALKAAREHANAAGRTRIRARDVEAVTKPRTEGASTHSLAVAAVLAWESESAVELDAALQALANHIGSPTLDAARRKIAA